MNKKTEKGMEAMEAAIAAMELVDMKENEKLNGKSKSTPKAKSKSVEPKAEAPAPVVIDITPIIASLPTDKPVTPATLDKLFQLNDGGKTVRRHLRKHYAEPVGHQAKSNWAWNLNDPILNEIIQYFAQRYKAAL